MTLLYNRRDYKIDKSFHKSLQNLTELFPFVKHILEKEDNIRHFEYLGIIYLFEF